MAILKHIAVKNADYSRAQQYLIFKHDEKTGNAILDENGNMQFRDHYLLDGINCDAFTFDAECMELNARFGKNQNYNEIKSHHYIISYDPKDAAKGLTGEHAQELGLTYAEKYFPGHQALVCIHTDGHNGSGNIHTHIVINSVRKFDVAREAFMERPCDSRAGCKHHLTKKYLVFLKQAVMDMCRRENLHQADLLAPAGKKITDREYRAMQNRKKKAAGHAGHVSASGIPQPAAFQTQKQFLRDAIEDAARQAHSVSEFKAFLFDKYRVALKESRGRFSYLHPERSRYMTGRSLGALYETGSVLKQIQNGEINLPGEPENGLDAGIPEYGRNKNKEERKKSDFSIPGYTDPANTDASENNAMPGKCHVPHDPVSILYLHSELRLVTDLQDCIKAQQSHAYAQKVKLSNLKRMAETVLYIQEHGYPSREVLEKELADAKTETESTKKELKNLEEQLKNVNEQIHYTGQYLANKAVYGQFLKAKNKGRFRQEHAAEITLYETAARFLKEKAGHNPHGPVPGKLPSLKLLQQEKTALVQKRESAQAAYQNDRDRQKELSTACANVNAILGDRNQKQAEKQKQCSRSEFI